MVKGIGLVDRCAEEEEVRRNSNLTQKKKKNMSRSFVLQSL